MSLPGFPFLGLLHFPARVTLKKRKSEGKVAGAMFADTVFIGTRWP